MANVKDSKELLQAINEVIVAIENLRPHIEKLNGELYELVQGTNVEASFAGVDVDSDELLNDFEDLREWCTHRLTNEMDLDFIYDTLQKYVGALQK